MATDRNNHGKGGNNNGNKGDKVPLVLLHGDDKNGGECVSAVHVFLRPLIWGLVWYLNHLLLQTLKERGPARYNAENRLIDLVLKLVVATKSDDLRERARIGWLELLAGENLNQVKALDEVAEILKVPTFMFEKGVDRPENLADAAIRLIKSSIFNTNKFVANNYQAFANALVEAEIITAEKADEVIKAALAERDGTTKKEEEKAA